MGFVKTPKTSLFSTFMYICINFMFQWKQFMALGKDVEDGAIEEKIAAQRPEQCALLIYTVRIHYAHLS